MHDAIMPLSTPPLDYGVADKSSVETCILMRWHCRYVKENVRRLVVSAMAVALITVSAFAQEHKGQQHDWAGWDSVCHARIFALAWMRSWLCLKRCPMHSGIIQSCQSRKKRMS
jgi:hypothetical protein